MVTLEFIPESEEQKSPEIEERKFPEKPQIQSCVTQFFKNNKNDLLDDRKKSSFLFFWNPSRTQVVTFSWGKKGCDYLGMCDYLGCDYLEALQ